MKDYYSSFGEYMAFFCSEKNTLHILHQGKTIVKDMCFYHKGNPCEFHEGINCFAIDFHKLILLGVCGDQAIEIQILLNNDKVEIITNTPVEICGSTNFDEKCYAMSNMEHDFMRCAYGPACTALDNMLFNVQKDEAMVVNGDAPQKFRFNYESGFYEIHTELNKTLSISVEANVYFQKYKIDYAPINKDTTFKKPPVGWMTWYAVQFDACEKTVLENTKWMAENLKKYGAETVWVDWEWYHKDLTGIRNDGCDTFNPDKGKYPNGLKYVSDAIRKYGLIPSIWIGFTNDVSENEFIKAHPDTVLLHQPDWCGQYFFDISHPAYLEEFLPKALKQVDDWGYEAVKYDTLPTCITRHEGYHSNMYNPGLSTKEAYRNMIKKTREILGKDRYLLSCSGNWDAYVLWGCDMFDAARVGNDIFNWDEFVEQGIGRTTRYYPFHNIVFYNDPDNVIVREEYNNFEQAKSRTAFVGMLGLPVTFGDNLPNLPEDRVELLRRTIPALDIHPMDICRMKSEEFFVTNLAVQSRCQTYNVVSILNMTNQEKKTEIHLDRIGVSALEPIVFEFYSQAHVKVKDSVIPVLLKPFETKIFAVRENTGKPQIISTSRHITQGALEMEALCWDDNKNELCFSADLVEGDNYIVTLYVPNGYKIMDYEGLCLKVVEDDMIRLSVKSSSNEKGNFKIKFEKACLCPLKHPQIR